MEIICFEPPTRWAERGISRVGELDLSLGFGAEGEATRIVLDAELKLAWPVRWAGRFAKPLMAREMKHDLARARRILEAERVVQP